MAEDQDHQILMIRVMQELHLLMQYSPEMFKCMEPCPESLKDAFQGYTLAELNGVLVELMLARQMLKHADEGSAAERGNGGGLS